eukprot:TRINITY_DN8575_c0_g1_i2.p1 TRINITY_DN8575_c0_g1~~TRINITY_DN8575_c0_g1_i2.p1  ORF type:complete len:236 (+),score=61.80 TRINITY_DN8575_c0_g1_i2:71-778(+)
MPGLPAASAMVISTSAPPSGSTTAGVSKVPKAAGKAKKRPKVIKPMTSYMLWLTANREALEARLLEQSQDPTERLSNNTFNSKAGQIWRDMRDHERAPFKLKAQQERVLYKSIHGIDPCAHNKKASCPPEDLQLPAVLVPALLKPPVLPVAVVPEPVASLSPEAGKAVVLLPEQHKPPPAPVQLVPCVSLTPGAPEEHPAALGSAPEAQISLEEGAEGAPKSSDTGVGIHPLFQY